MTITEIDEKFMREALAEALASFRLYGLRDARALLHVRGAYG